MKIYLPGDFGKKARDIIAHSWSSSTHYAAQVANQGLKSGMLLLDSWEVGISCNPAYWGLALRWNHS